MNEMAKKLTAPERSGTGSPGANLKAGEHASAASKVPGKGALKSSGTGRVEKGMSPHKNNAGKGKAHPQSGTGGALKKGKFKSVADLKAYAKKVHGI